MKKTEPTKHEFTVRFVGGPMDVFGVRTRNEPWPLKQYVESSKEGKFIYHLRIGGPGDEFDMPRYVLA